MWSSGGLQGVPEARPPCPRALGTKGLWAASACLGSRPWGMEPAPTAMHRPQSDLHVDTFLCVCTKDPGTAHSPQRSWRARSQPAPKARPLPAPWALRGPSPRRPGRAFAVHPTPEPPGGRPAPGQCCRWPHAPKARGDPTGHREPADGPPGVLPRGDRGLLSTARASPWCVFPSSHVLCAGRSGGSSLRTPDSSSAHLGNVPLGSAPSAPCCSTPCTAQGQRERATGRGVLSQAGLYEGWCAGGALLPGGP